MGRSPQTNSVTYEIVKVSPDCLQSHEMNKVSNSVRKSIKSDLKGVHKNHIENPFFQMCSYGFLVHPGPPKTLQNPLNRFILWDPGQKPENIKNPHMGVGQFPIEPYWPGLGLSTVGRGCCWARRPPPARPPARALGCWSHETI